MFLEDGNSYHIGRVLGTGMIGVATLSHTEITDVNSFRCLKNMAIDKIREKNLYKNVKDEVAIMYDLIGVEGVCQLENIVFKENGNITIVLPYYALTDLWNFMKVKEGRHLLEKDSRKVFVQLVETFIAIHNK